MKITVWKRYLWLHHGAVASESNFVLLEMGEHLQLFPWFHPSSAVETATQQLTVLKEVLPSGNQPNCYVSRLSYSFLVGSMATFLSNPSQEVFLPFLKRQFLCGSSLKGILKLYIVYTNLDPVSCMQSLLSNKNFCWLNVLFTCEAYLNNMQTVI